MLHNKTIHNKPNQEISIKPLSNAHKCYLFLIQDITLGHTLKCDVRSTQSFIQERFYSHLHGPGTSEEYWPVVLFLNLISIIIKFRLCFCTNVTEVAMCSSSQCTPPGGYMTAVSHHKTVAFNPVSSGVACTIQQATHNQNRTQFAFL